MSETFLFVTFVRITWCSCMVLKRPFLSPVGFSSIKNNMSQISLLPKCHCDLAAYDWSVATKSRCDTEAANRLYSYLWQISLHMSVCCVSHNIGILVFKIKRFVLAERSQGSMLFSPIVRKQLVIVRTLLRWSADPGSCSAEIPALIFSDFSVERHILRRVVCLIRNSSRTIMSTS